MRVLPHLAELAFENRGGVAWITLNRPQKANALTTEMLLALERALKDCAADTAVRALVLTGAGTRTFSAGADLTPVAESRKAQRRARFAAALLALLDFGKPAVAAVNGAACGAGMMLAVLCDAIVAARSARFALPEINKGLPTLPGVAILSQRFGGALAADLVLSGRFMEADEALARGLARHLVGHEELMERAQVIALTLGRQDARAYAHDKRWLNRTLRRKLTEAMRESARLHRS